MSYNFERHLDDESLERYAFGRLEETRTELLEEHLLICEGCRTRLDTTEQYIKAMARGSLLLRQQSTPSLLSRVNEWLASFRLPATAWAAAALAICAILYFSTANLRRGGPVLAPVAVSLLAERGPSEQTAPAHHPLLLHLDARGLDLTYPVHITLVNASGSQLEEKAGTPGASVDFRTAAPLPPGAYYIRILKSGSSESAREFALEVR